MEVHAHTHTPRKKWIHYFWEFLMLFLAVTLGFFVENQREHFVEHQREKKYAEQLLTDLKNDTSSYRVMKTKMKRSCNFYDSARLVFQQQPDMADDKFVRLARGSYTPYSFIIRSTTFNQMKSSGSLRYVKNTDLSSGLSDYYDQQVPKLLTFFGYLNEKLHTQIEPFFAQHFDLNVSSSYSLYDTLPGNLKYYERNENTDLLIKNYFQLYFIGVSFIMEQPLSAANAKAIELIKNLQKEYHLK